MISLILISMTPTMLALGLHLRIRFGSSEFGEVRIFIFLNSSSTPALPSKSISAHNYLKITFSVSLAELGILAHAS